jgi:hypothetical protein
LQGRAMQIQLNPTEALTFELSGGRAGEAWVDVRLERIVSAVTAWGSYRRRAKGGPDYKRSHPVATEHVITSLCRPVRSCVITAPLRIGLTGAELLWQKTGFPTCLTVKITAVKERAGT